MNQAFRAYVESGRQLCMEHAIDWDLPVNAEGTIDKGKAWDLTALAGATPPPTERLNDLGGDRKTIDVLNRRLTELGRAPVAKAAFSKGWQELIKATTIRQIAVSRNTPHHVILQVVRPLRVLGSCVQAISGHEPWEITADDLRFAFDVATAAQPSGAMGVLVRGVTRYILDHHHLCDRGPFHLLLKQETLNNKSKDVNSPRMRRSLSDRKSEEKLPELKALWELVRIVFTERPQTFSDAVHFAQIKLLILCGLRIGEVCSIPHDWKRVRDYVDLAGRPAGQALGVSRSLMLRHFAEKQRGRDEDSVVLYEAFQHVPPMFEKIIDEALTYIGTITAPLRTRLRLQAETGRAFPEFDDADVLPLSDLYVRMSGNARVSKKAIPNALVEEYRTTFQSAVLDKIAQQQARAGGPFKQSYRTYWERLSLLSGLNLKKTARIADIEALVTEHMPTKLSDTAPFTIGDGKILRADEFLFLGPKRATVEGRDGQICDVTRYFAVGRATPSELYKFLAEGSTSVFTRYGQTEEDRRLGINSHALRHLQNTELFRLGIADSIITKRFNRRSKAQSYEYDHRSLAEDLSAIDLPAAAQSLPEKARAVAAMIVAGRASGPIVDAFMKIQKEHGEARAFEFLAAEADGFHATPYGHCINSFTVDPCPKHLQCFDGCGHLVATDIERHRLNLERVRDKTLQAIDEIDARREGVGRNNQLLHAKRMIEGIEKILATSDGDRPFPDGQDLSLPVGGRRTPLDV